MLDFADSVCYSEAMKLKRWRIKMRYSQATLAVDLEEFSVAFAKKAGVAPEKKPKAKQTTIAAWEKGVTPRKFWIQCLNAFTKGQVTPNDFLTSDAA